MGADSKGAIGGAIAPTAKNLWVDAIIFNPRDRLKIQHQFVIKSIA